MHIRLLGRDDAATLRQLTVDDADFDLDVRPGPARAQLDAEQALEYLTDPTVLHWVAEEGDQVLGHLHCQLVRKHAGQPRELLLYEIGVRSRARRCGVGRALTDTMCAWMATHGVADVWVLADNPGATAFYEACGFEEPADVPVYLTRSVP
jgi:ribosomal protein S18 acetylase RimI-like enzyme